MSVLAKNFASTLIFVAVQDFRMEVMSKKMYAEEIKLPDGKREAMQNKLDEYRDRPQTWEMMSRQATAENDAKIAVLEVLLRDGVVASSVLEAQLRLQGDYDQIAFKNAVGVINNYVIDRPANVDGTGLYRQGTSFQN